MGILKKISRSIKGKVREYQQERQERKHLKQLGKKTYKATLKTERRTQVVNTAEMLAKQKAKKQYGLKLKKDKSDFSINLKKTSKALGKGSYKVGKHIFDYYNQPPPRKSKTVKYIIKTTGKKKTHHKQKDPLDWVIGL